MASIDIRQTNKNLLKNTGIIALGNIGTKALNFFLIPLYTAVLSTSEYGLIDLLSTYTMILVIIVNLQVEQSLFRFLVTARDNREESKRVISSAICFSCSMLVIYTICFCGIRLFFNIEYSWYLIIYVCVAILLATFSQASRGIGNNKAYAAGNFISVAVTIILNVIAVAYLHLGVTAMLVSNIAGPICGILFILISTKLYKYFDFRDINSKTLKKIVKYSLPLVPNEMSWWVIHASDRMIVNAVLGVAANGIIAVASKLSGIFTTIFSFFNASWTEQLILHYHDEGGKDYINKSFEGSFRFFSAVAIGLITVMPFIFPFMVNENFQEAYTVIPLYIVAVFFNVIVGLVSPIYLINNDTKSVAYSTIAAAVINFIVDCVLIRFVGILAAPISSICGYAAVGLGRCWDVNRRYIKLVLPARLVIATVILTFIEIYIYYQNKVAISLLGLLILFVFIVLIDMNQIKAIYAYSISTFKSK